MQATPTSPPKDVVSHTKLHRNGAEEARGTHNPEDLGSSPSSGIYHSQFIRTASLSIQQHFTGMAQRQRAWLITTRT